MKILKPLSLLTLITLLFSSCGYNKMVELDETSSSAWAQVQNQYQRRADLIPNLVEVVKGYAAHEKDALIQVIEARAKATSINLNAGDLTPEKMQQFKQAQEGLSSALSRLMVVVEKYPDLKANQNFLELQAQLEGTENRISTERMRFNESVKAYNSYIRGFPRVIYAGWFDFKTKEYFEAEATSQKAPQVKF